MREMMSIHRVLVLAAAAIGIASCGRPAPTEPPSASPTAAATAPAPGDGGDGETVLPPSYTVVTTTLLADPSGFPGAPAVSATGTIFIAGLAGRLSAVTPSGELLWDVNLPANAAGTPLPLGDRVYVLDRDGLNAFNAGGDLLWRFEHETGTAIAGPAAGPDGTLYYTLQSASMGRVRAVSAGGEPLWLAQVETFSYFRPPQPTPNGQFILFRSEVFSTIDGAPVDLGLDFEPEAFYIGADDRVYLLYQDSLVEWTFADGRAVLGEERVTSPHELGSPVQVGILEDGEVVFVYPAAVAWFTPTGRMLHLARAQEGFFTHLIAASGEGPYIVCGRSRPIYGKTRLPIAPPFRSNTARRSGIGSSPRGQPS